jgi:hypothetical protein
LVLGHVKIFRDVFFGVICALTIFPPLSFGAKWPKTSSTINYLDKTYSSVLKRNGHLEHCDDTKFSDIHSMP